MTNPYISFVISSRNDEYILDQEDLVLDSLDNLISQIDKYKFFAEIIFIEWNPPHDKKKYKDILVNLKNSTFVKFKLISVDNKYHSSLLGSKYFFLSGERAANVGIQNANGKFIINKSHDTYYSELFFKILSREKLQLKKINLIERHTIERKLVNETLANVIYNQKLMPKRKRAGKLFPYSLRSIGESLILEKKYWHKFRGYKETNYAATLGLDGDIFYHAYAYGLKVNILDERKNFILKPQHHKMFTLSVNEQISLKDKYFLQKLFSLLKHDKVYRGKVKIGRKSSFFFRLVIIRYFKFFYVFKNKLWGLKGYEFSNKEILSNKIEYGEIN